MKFLIFILVISISLSQSLIYQQNEYQSNIKSPFNFFEYEFGLKFTQYHQIQDYFKYLNTEFPNTSKIIQYGKTNQGRDLYILVISSEKNIINFSSIKANNVLLAKGKDVKEKTPIIVWLAYNVHGNEPSSSEASMLVAYHYLSGLTKENKDILENTVIIIDPMMNPDGRERYVNFYNNSAGEFTNSDPLSVEHIEPSHSGRTNHYYFDLNRDWFWASQIETQNRLLLYHTIKPQVFVDFHEMGYNETYFFFPAFKPISPLYPSSTVKWGKVFGEGNAKIMDKYKELYNTAERFDLFYPGYGDSYPSLNGSIGMTYEQAGIRGGTVVKRQDGSSLTLKDRAFNHYRTSYSTVLTALQNSSSLLTDFKNFHKDAIKKSEKEDFANYIVENQPNTLEFEKLLKFHQIDFSYADQDQSITIDKGKAYNLKKNQLIIPVAQAQYLLLKNVMDNQISIPDTAFYDISSWSVPKAFNVSVYKSPNKISITDKKDELKSVFVNSAYVYVLTMKGLNSFSFIYLCQKEGVKFRMAKFAFTLNSESFTSGSLIISAERNKAIDLNEILKRNSEKLNINLRAFNTGLTSQGYNIGSNNYEELPLINVALLKGDIFDDAQIGSIKFLFEQKLSMPVTIYNTKQFSRVNLDKFSTLILANDYSGGQSLKDELGTSSVDKLKSFVKNGGHIISLEESTFFLGDAGLKLTGNKEKKLEEDKTNDELANLAFEKREDFSFKQSFPGAFVKVNLDLTNPYCVGLNSDFYVMKTTKTVFEGNSSAISLGNFNNNDILGYVPKIAKKGLEKSPYIIHQNGYTAIASDPTFRMLNYGAIQLFLNIVFLGNTSIL